ncbi:MAG: flavodoxin family protein [Methanomassiliicoccales archaeon]
MRVILLTGDDGSHPVYQRIIESVSSVLGEVEVVRVDQRVSPCRGCFGCWIKTPGICVIDDRGRELVSKVIESDLLILLTPVTFGGYSSRLKRAVDRMIPLLLPFFRRYGGETHHPPRYPDFPPLWVIGVGGNRRQWEVFRELVGRNAINMHAPKHAVSLLDPDQEGKGIDDEIERSLDGLGVGR